MVEMASLLEPVRSTYRVVQVESCSFHEPFCKIQNWHIWHVPHSAQRRPCENMHCPGRNTHEFLVRGGMGGRMTGELPSGIVRINVCHIQRAPT